MAVQIQLRRDTAANFTSGNPVLAQGEMAVETDTLRYKLGDGATAWNGLQYGVFDGFTSGRRYQFDDTTTDADPGAGKVRFNHATFGSITFLYFDDDDYPGGDASAWLDALDDSSNPNAKGTLFLQKHEEPGTYREFIVTGAVVDGTGYRKVPVAPLSSNGALSDNDQLVVAFYRAGDAGTIETDGSKSALVGADGIFISDSEDGEAVKTVDWDDFTGEMFDAISLDEDDFASNSDTKLPTQQSTKAYVDGKVAAIQVAAPGHIYGLTLSNNASDATNDIDVAAGEATSVAATPVLMKLAASMTKRLDANWAPGSGSGMRYSGEAITNYTYHIYLIAKAGGADVDLFAYTGASASAALGVLQTESGGADYVHIRRIGSIMRASGAIRPFSQEGDEFLLKTPLLDVNLASTLGTTATLLTLSVPLGIKVRAILEGHAFHSAGGSYILTSPDQVDVAPSGTGIATGVNQANQYGEFQKVIRTNTSAQIRARGVTTLDFFRITTHGWFDTRGRST